MQKFFFFLSIFFLSIFSSSSFLFAGSVNVSFVLVATGPTPTPTPTPVHISDLFGSDTLAADWDQDTGTWSIGSGLLSSPSDAGGIVAYKTSLTGLSGCLIVQRGTSSNQFGGLGFRYVNDTERSYVVRWNQGIEVVFRSCIDTSCDQDIGSASSGGVSANYFLCVSWDTGTGNDIIVKVWRKSTLPSDPYDSSTWGAAATTWSGETITNPANTGTKVYIYTGNATVQDFKEFYGSDD